MSLAEGVIGMLLAVNSVTDLRKKEILPWFTLLAGLAGALWQLFGNASSVWSLFFFMLPGLFLLCLSKATGGKIGLGDGLVVWTGGIWLGFFPILEILLEALLLAFGASALLLLTHGRKKELPFVPFLVLAFILREL